MKNSNMNIENIVKRAIDLHVHSAPDILPRKYDAVTLVKRLNGKIRKICLKSHAFPTVALSIEVNKITNSNILIGSVVLNNFAGGMNPDIIYANAEISKSPFIVWFPTIHAENYLEGSKWEIRPEWVKNTKFNPRKSAEIKPVKIVSEEKLAKKVIEVLKAIKKCNCILATGHISWKEAEVVVSYASRIGIKKIVVTHPIYQLIDMPIKIQKKLVGRGAFIEMCYSMNAIDGIEYGKIVNQINEVGSRNFIISSDMGQTFGLDPDKALLAFAEELNKRGITKKELFQMMVINPLKLLS